eukprot:4425260-Pyramimonas_sp.AAC.1
MVCALLNALTMREGLRGTPLEEGRRKMVPLLLISQRKELCTELQICSHGQPVWTHVSSARSTFRSKTHFRHAGVCIDRRKHLPLSVDNLHPVGGSGLLGPPLRPTRLDRKAPVRGGGDIDVDSATHIRVHPPLGLRRCL